MRPGPRNLITDVAGPVEVLADNADGPHREVVRYRRTDGDGDIQLTFARLAWPLRVTPAIHQNETGNPNQSRYGQVPSPRQRQRNAQRPGEGRKPLIEGLTSFVVVKVFTIRLQV